MSQLNLTRITDLPEFQGWDVDPSDAVVALEYSNAWREFHNRQICPFKVNPQLMRDAKKFCSAIKLPFRYYIRWCVKRLQRFPLPWELNFKWLQTEMRETWLEVQQTLVPSCINAKGDLEWKIRAILRHHRK